MRKEDVLTAIGLSLPVIVCVVFVTLKLISAISWSWWWVMSPLWGVTALLVLLSLIYMALFAYRYRKYLTK